MSGANSYILFLFPWHVFRRVLVWGFLSMCHLKEKKDHYCFTFFEAEMQTLQNLSREVETTVWEERARLSTGSCSHSYTNATTSELPSLQNPKSEGLKGAMTRQVVAISCSCCIRILHSTHFPTMTPNVSHVCFYINGKYSPFSVISTGSCEEVAEESGCDSRTLISQSWSSAACTPWE